VAKILSASGIGCFLNVANAQGRWILFIYMKHAKRLAPLYGLRRFIRFVSLF
jgi:hypothetical protein